MIDISQLASMSLTFFIVAVSPGPATLSNAVVAMHQGRKVALIHGAGLACGLAFWGVIAASGMGVVLQGSVYLLSLLKIAGGLYLLWLALLAGKSAWRPRKATPVSPSSTHWFLQGLLLNLSNPKAVLAWVAALSLGLDADAGVKALVIATLLCMAAGVLVYVLYACLFSFAGVMQLYKRFSRWVDGSIAAFFTVAGLGLVRSSFVEHS